MDLTELQELLQYATPRQREVIETVIECRTSEKAAKKLGIDSSAVRRFVSQARKRARLVPKGFSVKRVSMQLGPDGEIEREWISAQPASVNELQHLLEAIPTIAEPIKGRSEVTRKPKETNDDLLCVYPLGDPHIGMLAWQEEVGHSFDLKIAEANLVEGIDQLVAMAPPATYALIASVGDLYHADSTANTTTAGTRVDIDTRWTKMISVGIRTMRRLIDSAKKKHKHVHVICQAGNHDTHSSIVLALCLAAYYENDPRVTVDTSPAMFHWYRFGENLIGVTHGDKTKPQDLPGIMAVDRKEDWGQTSFRYWITGHIHHEVQKEYPGCRVESFRTLAPQDAWHKASGYRAGQDTKCLVLHRDYGEIQRFTVGIKQIIEAQKN